ncbi:hypothetical protein N7G274_007331 [Stereocaulon virgatum]|uniref:Uncharacterized protein n=1 Tax=Stereocaulon virgatum TaxID=373712 RepID=A0ABR4A2Q1_9LECA
MLKFSSPRSDASRPCVPNLLPCRIDHNGPVDASPRYWAPEIASDGKPEAYFRGRKLKGKEVKVPTGYKGVIVKEAKKEDTGKDTEKKDVRDGRDNEEEAEEFSMLQDLGSFDKVMLWGHESIVESEDPFVKGMEEWIGFAEAMHRPGKSEGP